MERFVLCLSILVLLPGAMSLAIMPEGDFAGDTIIHSQGARFIPLRLSTAASLTSIDLLTDSPQAFALVLGAGNSFRYKMGPDVAGVFPDHLPAGNYAVYLFSGAYPMTSILAFESLGGEVEFTAASGTRGAFEPLRAKGLFAHAAASPIPGLQAFSGIQPFEGTAVTGFMVVTRTFAVEAETYEFRWSGPRGVTDCVAWGPVVGVGAGAGTSLEGVLHVADQGSRVTLDYFRYGASITTQLDVYGLWIERVPGDPAPIALEPVEPLVWGIDILDYDVGCVRERTIP